MLRYPLSDFIATVPSCVETATLATVLEIFQQQQCHRLAVLDKQKCLLGLVYSARLLPQLLTAGQGKGDSNYLDLQQPLSTLGQGLIKPIQTIPASLRIEQLSSFLGSQQIQENTNVDWALVDSNGKFLGLVDSLRLLKLLTTQKLQIDTHKGTKRTNSKKAPQKSSVDTVGDDITKVAGVRATTDKTHTSEQKRECKPLVQLLERLPWPLALQTSNGEVVTQNPAWWQQLGALKDPEGVRRQVETILAKVSSKKLQYATQTAAKISSFLSNNQHFCQENSSSRLSEVIPEKDVLPRSTLGAAPDTHTHNQQPQPIVENPASNRCFLDSQQGTCTCIVEVQNGQERVWQFAKIPLDSPELKVLSTDSKTPLATKNSALNNELWLMLATDVTEQQQLSKELAAKNADLIQLNRLKDEFLACISHELKTPLTAVLGLSRLLVDQQLGELNERQARYAGLIHQSGRHLMSVVNDILDLTRMETGQMELTLTNANIQKICERAVSEAKAIHSQTNKASSNSLAQSTPPQEHQFTLSMEPGLEQIVADELRLRQMLVHLLSNAFKFTETAGEIGLGVSRWEGWIAFTVWDTGIGIPEHQQHLIFQKFQQLENPLIRQHEGTGLGLVLTRALARLHGGDVSFLSREGKGSQFTLLLPPSPPKESGRLADEEMGTISFAPHHQSARLTKEDAVGASTANHLGSYGKTPTERLQPINPTQPHSTTSLMPAARIAQTGMTYAKGTAFAPGQVPGNSNRQGTSTRYAKRQQAGLSQTQSPTQAKPSFDLSNRSTGVYGNSPWALREAAVQASTTHQLTSSKSLVLVVEAVARYIEDLTEQLTGLGYRVVIARSGCEAVEKARRLQPKAIFLNPLLPLLSGWDVLTLLKSDVATSHIPTIVTATGAEKEQAFANQADGFLSLPVQHQVLTPLIESLCTPPEQKQQKSDDEEIFANKTPLKILKLVHPDSESSTSQSLLQQHRVIEVDDLDQAELLTRVWQFDVILLDTEMPAAEALLQQLSSHPRLANLPLVTCNVSTTQAASVMPGLSVFPCLTPLGTDKNHNGGKTDALLSALQIASDTCYCPPNILVVDLGILPDLPDTTHKQIKGCRTPKNFSLNSPIAGENTPCPWIISRGSEWFQALVQYLQTGGFKASMSRSWAELLQQIRHQSVDLLLICLGECSINKEVHSALKALQQLPFDLPPVLLLDQRLNSDQVEDEQTHIPQLESIETLINTLASQILPRSISMENLLNEINKTLETPE
ncbi:ATP-binding protein [Brasilonema sennae]|nr:ATP-binding protein [Brasilonema sennae]